ncbi:uncharacterized protein PHALS_06597 [Plasmopara halstedii]|uniref:Uncharacterized protein n=1 Tax=Plasmopara halstedii TaxID=4781 RepID=A0A0P1B5L1_PLAHL|nr:uncharacterized protein PHALS_06597 [Plasmopara halstedii]CEG48797.1 hypothetical protein PHALS_06597 [Plasmopara halstedii]|eukprot:XP_024585166.1 hypothetical protein PHALS_06597 [Plasmopara halstedii]
MRINDDGDRENRSQKESSTSQIKVINLLLNYRADSSVAHSLLNSLGYGDAARLCAPAKPTDLYLSFYSKQ